MKKFFKKPFNIVSLVLAVLGLIGMIVILCIPHGGTYKMTDEVDGTKVTYYYIFKGDDLYMNIKTEGKFEYEGDGQKVFDKVEFKGGKAYVLNREMFKINAFRLEIEDVEKTFTCTASIVFFIVAGVMFIAGAAGLTKALVFKKKKK